MYRAIIRTVLAATLVGSALAGALLGSIVEKNWGHYFYFMAPFGVIGCARRVVKPFTPTQIELYNYPVIPQNNNTYTSFYGSDTWTIARRLTLNLGGRFDPPDAPQAAPPAAALRETDAIAM
jgi:outer membrane receptor protein involved in Fe transport